MKLKIKKILTMIISCLLVILIPINAHAQTTMQEIKDRGKFIIATSADYPPYEFHAQVNGKDEIIGLDIKLAQALADEMGVELEVRDLGFEALLPAVESGQVDAVLAGMNPTPEREKSVDFSDVYYEDKPAIVILEENKDKFDSQDKLKGETIGAQTGSIQAEFAAEIEDSQVYQLSNINNLIVALETGKISALVLTNSTAQVYQSNKDNLYVYDGNFNKSIGGDRNAIVFPKGSDEMVEFANSVIKKAKEEDKFQEWLAEVSPYVINETDEDGNISEENEEGFLGLYWNYFWQGTKTTIFIAILSTILGTLVGSVVALMRRSKVWILKALANVYVEFLRGTPLMSQLMFIYFGLGMLIDMPALTAGIIAMSLNSGAYVAEIIRSGINSVSKGQSEAARSLGLSSSQTMRKVIFPQAIRNIWPALGNEFITIIKESSIISTIGVAELSFQTNIVRTQSYKGVLPLFISMCIYFILTFTLSRLLNYYEKKMANKY